MQNTNFNDISQLISKYVNLDIDKLLVLGCGELRYELNLNANHILGIDWSDEQLDKAKNKSNVIVIKYDITEIKNILRDKSFDSVVLIDVLEHLEKKDALNILIDLEKIVKDQIILFVPIQEKIENLEKFIKYQKDRKLNNLSMGYHLSNWTPQELELLGFIGEYSEKYHIEKNMGAIFCVKTIL
jgi:2-polyprenyl-3-methyl-5-hydroxy-6-metoxy-1,4-benzoquinol methylase